MSLSQILRESKNNNKYYRAVNEHLGEEFIFSPEGYYEKVDDDGNLVHAKYGGYQVSDVGELSASTYIGGAVMGAFSMRRNMKDLFIYEINEKPDVDLTDYSHDDFEFISEVRYRKEVKGEYVGKVKITTKMNKVFSAFYEVFNYDFNPNDLDISENTWDVLRNLQEFLNKIDTQ